MFRYLLSQVYLITDLVEMWVFLYFPRLQNVPEAHPASYLLRYQTVASPVKLATAEAKRKLPSDADVLSGTSFTTLPTDIIKTALF
jgi:hypothetical protein